MSVEESESNDSIDAQDLEALLQEVDEVDEVEQVGQVSQINSESAVKRHRRDEEEDLSEPEGEGTLLGTNGLFALLPDELSSQLLARLSAVDLTSVAQTCKFFSSISGANDLWRPLFSCRWREGTRENMGLLDQPSWKASYMERDRLRGEQLKLLISDNLLQTSYLQSLVAERHMTVPQQPQALLPSNKALWGRITRWRGARGLLKCPSPNLGSQHQDCSLKGPFTELPGGLYMCESCGWAHLCGEGCSEKLVDEVSESLVCPISGRCFDRMINDAEDDGREDQEGEAGCDFGVAGHWGRAYSVGYNCSSEEELKFKCGIVM